MASSFIVNKSDLDFILEQIQISEAHSGGASLAQAIADFYGIDVSDASILPAGLRTVSGEYNNLIVGREDFGAADGLFPRLLDPSYKDEQDEAPGGFFGVTNTNYDSAENVVDSDPRIISNLIVDQTVANPAAIYAALASIGVSGTEATAAVAAITAAFQATQNANGASAAVTAAEADLNAANAALVSASAANAAVVAEYDAYVAADPLAADAAAAVTGIPAQLTALEGLLVALGTAETDSADAQAALIPLEADEDNAQALLDAAQATLNGIDPLVDSTGHASATAERDARAADLAAATALADPARALVTSTGVALTDAQTAASDAYDAVALDAGDALAAAQAVQAALDPAGDFDFSTAEANAAAAEAQDLANALTALNGDGLDSTDAPAVAAANAAFDDTAAQTSADGFPVLISDAFNALAGPAAALTNATVAQMEAQVDYDDAVVTAGTAGTPETTAAFLAQSIEDYGLETGADGALFIQNISPDIGLSQGFNSFMTIFGQFFDHGLDLVTKGGNGTVFIPLEEDDPLIAGADGVFGTADDLAPQLRFMALTRATQTIDADGVVQHENTTTPFVDQNQTYTSHASHQVFLREYTRTDLGGGAETYATGRLLDGQTANGSHDGAIGNWGEVKDSALEFLGILLDDFDVHNVPLLATDPYGNLIKGANGYAQLVMEPDATHTDFWLQEGTFAGVTTAGAAKTGHQFLADIAHHAAPGAGQVADADSGIGDDGDPNTYDDEMLESHFISGDGRGNENIALTMIHGLFHSEHNRQMEANKQTILDSGDIAYINEWALVPITALPTSVGDIVWNGDRMFQAARFSTEMQYQHMVVEEFARTITPGMEPFAGNNDVNVDPDIIAEFAHAVYRFGHSMLNSSVDRFDNDLNPLGPVGDEQISLIDAFLNPQAYLDSGVDFKAAQASLVRGITQDLGNEIDEFVVGALRSNLLGLPLDLAALNIARGRETGTATLQDARAQLSNDFGLNDLNPYSGWGDFAANIKTPLSVINFIAAYGTHQSILDATTLEEKRDAATTLVLGDGDLSDGVTINGVNYSAADRTAFLAGTGIYQLDNGGLDAVDLWIGGLAEAKNEFGGFLGTTFNFLFEYQMEALQAGDRLYYLHRTGGLNLLDQLEANTFADIVRRNTELGDEHATHINAALFSTPDAIFEMDLSIAQADYNGAGAGRDMQWDDPQIELLNPKVVRIDGTLEADGHYYGGEFHFNGGEHVVIGGTEGDDTITSGLGDDAIWGDGGNDYINAGAAADDVHAGEGDDIIVDPFGENVLRGEDGNDVISVARSLNLIFGGRGSDALLLGQDGSEAFGGEGNDFVMGGAGDDGLAGSEGDDWVEGGDGADRITTDNSPILPNPNVGGDDVAWGQGGDTRYELEGGHDIAFAGGGIDRFEGLSGFDWAIGKYATGVVNLDLEIGIFTDVPAQILQDRFNQMEALSGWNNNDILSGDNAGQAIGGIIDPLDFDNHVLDARGIALIDGLEEWFEGALETLGGAGATSFRDGNILMGGDGSDEFRGRGGNDIIDGDAWLNARIRIVVDDGVNPPVEYSAESMNSSTMSAGPNAGKVFNIDANGDPDFTSVAFDGRSLTSLLLDRTIKPGDMSIVRELKTDPNPANDIDIAFFQGTLAEYEIEGAGTVQGIQTLNSFDVNGDGFISITDLDDGVTGAVVDGVQLLTRGILTDNMDLLKNIERVQFSDQVIDLNGFQTNNQAPVAVDDAYLAQAGTQLAPALGVLDNDSDADGGILAAAVLAGPASGTLVLAADGSFTYDPDAGFAGEDSFTYTVTDGQGGSAIGTATITVNAAPVAVDDTFAATTDTTLNVAAGIGVLANDSDAETAPGALTATLVINALNGDVTLNGDGSFDYIPDLGYTGPDSFTYSVDDGDGGIAEATVSITVADLPNNAPVGVDDAYAVTAGTPLIVGAGQGILSNDTDLDGDVLAATLTGTGNGSLSLNTDGSFTYDANGFVGVDSFTYQVADPDGATDTATVSFTVTAPSGGVPTQADFDATIIGDEFANTLRGTGSLNEWIDAREGNDKIIAGAGDDYIISGSGNDTYVLGGTGADIFQYGPGDNNIKIHDWEDGIDLIHLVGGLTFADLNMTESNGTVSIWTPTGDRLILQGVAASTFTEADILSTGPVVNLAPVGVADAYTMTGDTSLSVLVADGVLDNDTDANGDALTATLVGATSAQGFAVSLNADGSFDYTPGAGFTGADSFTYTASDGALSSSATTVSLTVEAPVVNEAPVGVADAYTMTGDTSLSVLVADGVLDNDTDANGDALTATLVGTTSAAGFAVSLNADGSFDYTPDAGFTGPDSFVYTASDGALSSSATTVSLTVEVPVMGGDPTPADYDNTILGDGGANTLRGVGAANEWIDAQAGNDKIIAGAGDDYIIAGSGSDNFVLGGTGADIFQFGLGDNTIKIHDWEDGIDLINLMDGQTFADLNTTESNGTVSLWTTAGDRLILQGVAAASIDENDFL